QPARTEDEEKAQMTPTISPASQMRWARTAIRREGCRDFCNSQFRDGGFYYHLARKFHAGALKIELDGRIARKAAQSTVEISARTAKEKAANGGQDGIAEIFVQGRHRPRLDAAAKA